MEAERQRQEAIMRQETELRRTRLYQSFIQSAQQNYEQRQFVQARQDYQSALELNQENAEHINARIAELNRLIAEQERQRAAEQVERERRFNSAMESGEKNLQNRLFNAARRDFESALSVMPQNATMVNRRIAELDRLVAEEERRRQAELRERERRFNTAMQTGERHLQQGRHEDARRYFQNARNIMPENSYRVNSRIAEVDRVALAAQQRQQEAARQQRRTTWLGVGALVGGLILVVIFGGSGDA